MSRDSDIRKGTGLRLSTPALSCLRIIKRPHESDVAALNRILETLLPIAPDLDHFFGPPKDGRGPSGNGGMDDHRHDP